MERMDCKDIKALLSPLVDGVVDEEKRHAVERHLADCRNCRDMLDEAERLNELVAQDMAAREGDDLPDGFCQSVLARTVRVDESVVSYSRRWTTWTGWFAAAASLALAATIWIMDRQTGLPQKETLIDEAATVNYRSDSRSTVYEGPTDSIASSPPSVTLVSTILPDYDYDSDGGFIFPLRDIADEPETPLPDQVMDADNVARAAVLWDARNIVQGVAMADMSSWADIEQVRQFVVYEESLLRLRQAGQLNLPEDERLLLERIQKQVQRIVDGNLDVQFILDLQQEYRDYAVLESLQRKYDETGLGKPV